jgi:hypothetical protein
MCKIDGADFEGMRLVAFYIGSRIHLFALEYVGIFEV